eukprot:14687624-Heterocapsa_arctica.AAC.1
MAIALCSWSLALVQELLSEAVKVKEAIGEVEGGLFPAGDLQTLHDKIPKAVQKLYPKVLRPGAI